MKGDFRCVYGRLMRHDPQPDDPYLETDRGTCHECDGAGCRVSPPCQVCGKADGIISWPDFDRSKAICPYCCAKEDHEDTGPWHEFHHDRGRSEDVCDYCGISRTNAVWPPNSHDRHQISDRLGRGRGIPDG